MDALHFNPEPSDYFKVVANESEHFFPIGTVVEFVEYDLDGDAVFLGPDPATGAPRRLEQVLIAEEVEPAVAVTDLESAVNPGEVFTMVARFGNVTAAEQYIAALPDQEKVERGGYSIDAPEEA